MQQHTQCGVPSSRHGRELAQSSNQNQGGMLAVGQRGWRVVAIVDSIQPWRSPSIRNAQSTLVTVAVGMMHTRVYIWLRCTQPDQASTQEGVLMHGSVSCWLLSTHLCPTLPQVCSLLCTQLQPLNSSLQGHDSMAAGGRANTFVISTVHTEHRVYVVGHSPGMNASSQHFAQHSTTLTQAT